MPLALEELAGLVGGTLVGAAGVAIDGAATLATAGPDDLTLIDAIDKLHLLGKSRAAAALVPRDAGPRGRPTGGVDDGHAAVAPGGGRRGPPR
ncbi:MAG: hypothetical protein ACKOTB_17585, partial [Planctomycetia bacterium]